MGDGIGGGGEGENGRQREVKERVIDGFEHAEYTFGALLGGIGRGDGGRTDGILIFDRNEHGLLLPERVAFFRIPNIILTVRCWRQTIFCRFGVPAFLEAVSKIM